MNRPKISFTQAQQIQSYSTLETDMEEFDMKFVNTRQAIKQYNVLVKDFILLIISDEDKIESLLNYELAIPLRVYLRTIQQDHQKNLNCQQSWALDVIQYVIVREHDLIKADKFFQLFKDVGIYTVILFLDSIEKQTKQYKSTQFQQIIHYLQQYTYLFKILQSKQLRSQHSDFKIFQYPIFQKHEIQNLQEYKTMIVIGQTGSGKSTMINFFINYYLGIEFEDNFRFLLIQEETIGGNQAVSQTQDVNIYYIKPINGNPGLRIIDTPGFGDTRGIAQDKIIAEKIQKCFKNDVETVTTICFIVQSSNARLTGSQNYILSSITQMFGKDIIENFIFMFTFCDAGQPQAKNALLFKGDSQNQGSHVANLIPQIKEPWFLKLNSSAFLSPNRGEEQEIFMSKMFWNIGMASFKNLVHQKLQLRDVSLKLTKEIFDWRSLLFSLTNLLKPKIEMLEQMCQNYQQAKLKILQLKSLIQGMNVAPIKVKNTNFFKTDLKQGEYATNCLQCNNTCHYPCLKQTICQKVCRRMKFGVCSVCKCQDMKHETMNFRIQKKKEELTIEMKEVSEMILKYNEEQEKQEDLIENIVHSFDNLLQECLILEQNLIICVKCISEKGLHHQFYKYQSQYFQLMIEEEQKAKRDNFLERINYLQKELQIWTLIEEITLFKHSTIFEKFQRESLLMKKAIIK